MDQPRLGVEVLEAVPGEGHRIENLALRQDAEVVHQLLVGVAAIQAGHDPMHVPAGPGAVDQHHRGLLDPLSGGASLPVGDGVVRHAFLDGHRRSLQGDVPEFADIAEHQHVGVEVKRLAGVARQLGNGEAGEGEVGARSLADVLGLGKVEVDQRADLHLAAGMALDRVLQHRHRQKLRPVGPDIHPHHVSHSPLRPSWSRRYSRAAGAGRDEGACLDLVGANRPFVGGNHFALARVVSVWRERRSRCKGGDCGCGCVPDSYGDVGAWLTPPG